MNEILRQRKHRGEHGVCLSHYCLPGLLKLLPCPGDGGQGAQSGGDAGRRGRCYVMIRSGRGAFSAHSFLDCESGELKMQGNTAAWISSPSWLHCNHPGGFKAASVLLYLLFLRVDSPAGKFHCRSHLESLSSVVRWQLWLETLSSSAEKPGQLDLPL